MTIPENFKGFGIENKENWNKLNLIEYKRKELGPHDVLLKNIACGLCGTDIHTLQENWSPLLRDDQVVGHEIIGHVMAVGSEVSEFKIGDRCGIGAACSSCMKCGRCHSDNEQYCFSRVSTYNSYDADFDYYTQGGYSSHSIAHEQFVFKIPDSLETVHAAPLMCAGLTVFSPLVRNIGYDAKGKTVGIIGIGGLGHLALQFAKALGANVIAFSRSSSKKKQAMSMGASSLIATGEELDWKTSYADSFDFILNCASGIEGMNLNDYLSVLKVDAKFVSVGLPPARDTFQVSPFSFTASACLLGSSLLGSKREAETMLKLASEQGVKPWVEEVPISAENCATALDRCNKGDVRYRFVFTEFDKVFA